MADSNHSRRADSTQFLENDPFAELTRIMGHDPRTAEAAPQAEAIDDADFEIDLEKELMGELDFEEFDEPEAQAAQDEFQPAREGGEAEAFGDENVALGTSPHDSYGVELDPVDDAAEAGEASGEFISRADADQDFAPAEAEGSWREPDGLDGLDFASAMEQELAGDEPSDEPVADWRQVEPARFDAAAEEKFTAPDAAALDESAADVDVDMDFGFIEDDLASDEDAGFVAAAAEPSADEIAADDDRPADFPAGFDAAANEEAPLASASLEDELSALLMDEGSPAAQEEAAGEWHPTVNTFGHADPAAFEQDEAVETDAETASAWPSPHAAAAPPPPVSMLDEDDFADIFRDDELASNDDPRSDQAADDGTAAAAAPAAAPFAMRPVSVTPASEASHSPALDMLASWEPQRASATGGASRAASELPPEVETVEVTEGAHAMVDDLDIPEIDYASPAAPTGSYDDLESEIAQAFGDLSVEDPASAAQPTPQTAAWAGASAVAYADPASQAQPQYAAGPEEPAQGEGTDPYALGEGQWQGDQSYADDGFDYDSDVEQAMAMSAFENEPGEAAQPRKRGILVAAVVAGVAVIGGVGLFGMSLFGGGSDEPAIVRADDDPMKVRPENPGGATVPNQDNQVYRRVSEGPSEVDPEQERLISTAEDPVDITAATDTPPPALAPGIVDSPENAEAAGDDMPAQAAGGAPKAEDRITAETTTPETAAAEEVALVAPRRVRTMIVRPDGTMVPREETAASVEPQETASVLSQPSVVGASSLAPADGDAEEGGPVVNTPDTVAVVPSQRSQQPAASSNASEPARQQAATQTPAATPVSAPAAAAPTAAATSEWSMQIASQPTAEGAQATYQDLARRYGGVLQGRGVNIVRADIQGMGTYYRVRIPASNRDEAIRLCTEYKSAGGSCFVSR